LGPAWYATGEPRERRVVGVQLVVEGAARATNLSSVHWRSRRVAEWDRADINCDHVLSGVLPAQFRPLSPLNALQTRQPVHGDGVVRS